MKPIFDAKNLCTDICKTVFVILKVQFHHERGLSETRYFELFLLTWSRLSPYQKSASAEAPFNLFWTLTMILAICVFWKSHEIFLVQNLGHNLHKKCKIFRFGNSFSEKQPFTFGLFFGCLKTLLDTFTYSAVVVIIFCTAHSRMWAEAEMIWYVQLFSWMGHSSTSQWQEISGLRHAKNATSSTTTLVVAHML